MKLQIGIFFLILGAFSLILYGVSIQSDLAEPRLLLVGIMLLAVGGWFFLRNRPKRASAERFRTIRKIQSKRKKK